MNDANVTIKGVEEIDGLWHVIIERHQPCVDPYSLDHEDCTVVQRFIGPGFESKDAAIAVLEHVEVISEGELLEDWEETGS